jgi:hypothetical protein
MQQFCTRFFRMVHKQKTLLLLLTRTPAHFPFPQATVRLSLLKFLVTALQYVPSFPILFTLLLLFVCCLFTWCWLLALFVCFQKLEFLEFFGFFLNGFGFMVLVLVFWVFVWFLVFCLVFGFFLFGFWFCYLVFGFFCLVFGLAFLGSPGPGGLFGFFFFFFVLVLFCFVFVTKLFTTCSSPLPLSFPPLEQHK